MTPFCNAVHRPRDACGAADSPALPENRSRFRRDLDTAFVYLADAEAQRGFEAAVQAGSAVQSRLEGQTEKLVERRTVSGATVYMNPNRRKCRCSTLCRCRSIPLCRQRIVPSNSC